MADYTTVRAMKNYLSIPSEAEDPVLVGLIARASAMIDDYCGRWFSPIIETRRYAASGSHITGRLLLLDADLLAASAVSLGDGNPLDPSRYVLRPVAWPPYFGISLKPNSGLRWSDATGTDQPIAVSGTWGYALTTPEPVVTAAMRLAAWLYRQQQDRPAAVEDAAPPVRLPGDIRHLLGPYVRLRISAYSVAA